MARVGHINYKVISLGPEIIFKILQPTQHSSITSPRMDTHHIHRPPSANGISVYYKDAHGSHPASTYHPRVGPPTYNFPPYPSIVTNGIQRVRPRVSLSRLPVTPTILRRVKTVLDQDPSGFSNRLLWVVCCTAFPWFHEEWQIYSSQHLPLQPRPASVDEGRCHRQPLQSITSGNYTQSIKD